MTQNARGRYALACAAALALWFTPARAQDAPAERREEPRYADPGARDDGGRGFLMVGYHQLDLNKLNRRFVAHDYPTLPEGMLTLGGGGWAVRGRWMIGGEGQGLIGRTRTTSDGVFKTRLYAGYGMLDVGYRAYARDRVDVYPMLGIGGGSFMLDITEPQAPTFDDVLGDPGRGARLTAGMFAVSLSLGTDFAMRGRRTRHGEGGPDIGARIGYLFSTTPNTWRLDDRSDVRGVPDVSLTGPFFMVMVGGWGRR